MVCVCAGWGWCDRAVEEVVVVTVYVCTYIYIYVCACECGWLGWAFEWECVGWVWWWWGVLVVVGWGGVGCVDGGVGGRVFMWVWWVVAGGRWWVGGWMGGKKVGDVA